MFARSIQQAQWWISVGPASQTGIEPAMGYDAGPTLNWHLVGWLTSYVRGTSNQNQIK